MTGSHDIAANLLEFSVNTNNPRQRCMKRNNICIACSKQREAAHTLNELPIYTSGHWWPVAMENGYIIPNICPFNCDN